MRKASREPSASPIPPGRARTLKAEIIIGNPKADFYQQIGTIGFTLFTHIKSEPPSLHFRLPGAATESRTTLRPQGLAFWPDVSPCGGGRPFQILNSAPPVCQWPLLGVRPHCQACLRSQPLSGHPLGYDQTHGKLQRRGPASGKSWLLSWVLRSPQK